MQKEEIHLWDIKRILFGQAPPEFLIEVFIRSLIIYLLAMVVMRWLGKRMNGQITIVELAVMVMMGAIVAVPMQIPDRGLLQGFIVLLVVLLLHRGVNRIAFNHSNFEKTLQGELTILVKDGVLELKALDDANLSRPQLFSVLRSKEIYNLGKVKRMYLEACGTYSVYTEEDNKPGLLLYPRKDESIKTIQQIDDKDLVCGHCGWIMPKAEIKKKCPNCHHSEWEKPII